METPELLVAPWTRLQEEIVTILCELEMYFPPAFFYIMVHLLVHIVDDIINLGPAFLHNMMPFDNPQEQGITVAQFDKYLSVEPTRS